MPWSIELFFEPAANTILQAAWRTLAGPAGSDYVLQNGVHPHVALAVFDELPAGAGADAFTAALSAFALQCRPPVMRVKGVGRFPASRVIYLGIAREPALLRLHSEVTALLSAHDRTAHTYYRADRWVPHCTLAQQVPPDRLDRLERIARDHPWPTTLRADRLALVSFPPTRVVWSQTVPGATP